MMDPPNDAPSRKPLSSPRHVTKGGVGIGSTRQITWLPGVVFAWAIAVAFVGIGSQISPQHAIGVAMAALFSMGALCGFADEQRVWSGVLFFSPLTASLALVVSLGNNIPGVSLLAAMTAGYVWIGAIWLIAKFVRGVRLFWTTLGIIVIPLSTLFLLALVGYSEFAAFAMLAIVIAVFSVTFYALAISFGGLFRVAYEFRQPSIGLPKGWIPRQFSLSSMFGATTWFAIMFATFSLEQVTLHQVALGTLALVIGGTVVFVVLSFQRWQSAHHN